MTRAEQGKEAELRGERERMAAEMERLRAACEEARREAAAAQHALALRDASLRVRARPPPLFTPAAVPQLAHQAQWETINGSPSHAPRCASPAARPSL
jgi:septal ring factor EnvC (AmiA/AmiB activator)